MACEHLHEEWVEYPIEWYEDKSKGIEGWAVEGCCGNCLAIKNIKYCPFCGEALKKGKHDVSKNKG